MNPLVLQILTAALQMAPLAVETVTKIKELIARDPSTPVDLAKILTETANDNAATLAAVQQFINDNPV